MGDDEHLVTDSLHLAQNMAGQNDGVGLAQVVDQRANLDHLCGIQADGGLVQDDDLGVAQQGGGNAHTLAIALGQVADQPLLHVFQTGAAGGALDAFQAGCLGADAFELRHKHQILPHRHVGVQRRLLGQIPDAGFCFPGFLHDVVTVDPDSAAGGGQISGDDVHGGGLAGAVGPQQTVNAAIFHGEADVIHRAVVAVALCQVVHFDQSTHTPFLVLTGEKTPLPGVSHTNLWAIIGVICESFGTILGQSFEEM